MSNYLERPIEVRRACQLILCAWLISEIGFHVFIYTQSFASMSDNWSTFWIFLAASIVVLFPRIWLVREIWLGRKWSRHLMSSFLALSWVIFFYSIIDDPVKKLDPLATITKTAGAALEAVSIILLYRDKASRWFAFVSSRKP
jgi:hypothetical protein